MSLPQTVYFFFNFKFLIQIDPAYCTLYNTWRMWILDIPIVLADSSSINISTEDGYHSRHFIFFERASFLKEKCASVDLNRNVSLLDEWTSILSFRENKSAAQYFLIYLCLMSSDADPDRSWSGLSHAYYDLKMFSWWRWYVQLDVT